MIASMGMTSMTLNLSIPAIAELAEHRQWVCREAETKIPLRIDGACASSTDPETWASFAEVHQAHVGGIGAGLGFAFTKSDPFVGIDLDGAIEGSGKLLPWARQIVDEVDSFTEISPSGRGLHIIARGKLPPAGRERSLGGEHTGVGMYETGRYFTVTGVVFEGRDTIHDGQDSIDAVHRRMFSGRTNGQPGPSENPTYAPRPYRGLPATVARLAKWNGSLAERLEKPYGEIPRLCHLSDSEVDLSLANTLASCGCAGWEIEHSIYWRRESIGRPKRLGYYVRTTNLVAAPLEPVA